MKPLKLKVNIETINSEILKDLYIIYKEKYGRTLPDREIDYILDYILDTKLIYSEMKYLEGKSEIFIDTLFGEEVKVLTYNHIIDTLDIFSNIGRVYDYTGNNIKNIIYTYCEEFSSYCQIEKDSLIVIETDDESIYNLKVVRTFKKEDKRYIKKDS